MSRPGAGLVLTLAAAACGAPSLFRARRVERQEQAGSVHFSLLSVAPWREYVDALQPRFELSAQNALAQVVPATRLMQESLVDIVQAAAGAATPQRSRTRQEVEVEGGAAVGTTTIDTQPSFDVTSVEVPAAGRRTEVTTETKEEFPAFPPSVTVPTAPIARAPSLPAPPERFGEAAVDPMTRYWAATALYQEVQLLNRYVRDAAVRQGFDPYVVRLQVSLMPAARGEPYDAYCTLGFFSSMERGAPLTSPRDPGTGRPRLPAPQIVPLMVTDNLEAGMQARTLDTVRQLAGAVYAMNFSAGASADVTSLQETLESVFGQDLNSLLTVGRVSDNTIRVRLGALQQATSDFAMVPRSHNVTLLLLVPEGSGPSIDVVMRATMVDAESGDLLPGREPEEIAAMLEEVARVHGLARADSDTLLWLLGAAQRNDRLGFEAELAKVVGSEGRARELTPQLWVDLVATMAGSQYASTQFDLPRGPLHGASAAAAVPSDQTALLEDDLQAATATLRSGGIGSLAPIDAVLRVPWEGRELSIPAESFSLDEVSGTLRLRFPSLAAWGLCGPTPGAVTRLRLLVTVEGRPVELEALHRVKG